MRRIRPWKFIQLVYRTRHFDAMVQQYAAIFDARILHQGPALAVLTSGDEHRRFDFVNPDVPRPGASIGQYH